MIARGEALTEAATELVLVVLLSLLSMLVLTVFLRALEGLAMHFERKHDRPLLFVRAESSTSRALGGEGWRVRLRRLLDALSSRARPSAREVDVQVPPEGDERPRTGSGADDPEAALHEHERSAVFEVDPARGAREGLEVGGADVAARPASSGDEGSGSVGHVENLLTGSEGRSGR